MSSDARPSDAPIEPVGRTWADILFAGRRLLLLVLGVVVLLVLVAIYRPDLSGISEWYRDNKPAIRAFVLAFILMFVIGRFITLRLISVQTVDYLVLDFVNLRGAVYRIPVPLLSSFRISGGNNLQLSWRDGHVFKLARSVSIEDGIIAKIENLLLRRRPVVLAADLARDANDHLASELSDLLELGDLDVDSYLNGLDPLKPRKGSDEGSDDTVQEGSE